MRHRPLALAAVALLLTTAAAYAVKPQAWNHATEKDFAEGKFDNTVVDSYGQLTLGRQLTPLDLGDEAEVVTGITQNADGDTFVATGGPGRILRISADKPRRVYTAPKDMPDINTLLDDGNGNLLVAVSGDNARLVRVATKAKIAPVTVFEDKDVSAIWTIVKGPDGATYIGTGPKGTVYKIDGEGKATPVLTTKSKNILALAFDKDANLIAGTDGNGLVIRVDKTTGKSFVLLDAGKTDVNALVSDPKGNLYVATAVGLSPEAGESKSDEDAMDKDTKSKPGTVEPEPVDPPDDANEKPNEKPNKSDKPAKEKGGAMIDLSNRSILALQPDESLSKALEALAKLKADDKQQTKPKPPATTKKSPPAKPTVKHKKPFTEPDEEETASAVYRIAPDGAVETIVDGPDANYALLLAGDELLIGTGQDGKLFSYRPADDSLALIARLHQEEITTLFAAKNGTIYIGAGGAAAAYTLGSGLSPNGTFLSPVLDAKHTAHWGRATLTSSAPTGTKVTVATRTGNTRDVLDNEKLWSPWSDELAGGTAIPSPAARYLQYRVTLTGDGKTATPELNAVRIVYQSDNLAPKIKSVTVESDALTVPDDGVDLTDRTADAEPATTTFRINWDATDPNHDDLSFRLLYRTLSADDKELWIPLTKDLKDDTYEWETRGLPDSKYQVKVIASDSPDNPAATARTVARTSAPFTIDHTPPVLGDITATVDGNKASLAGSATDAASAIADVRFQVDGQGDWQPAAPSDKIFDSPQEAFTAVTRPLSAGGHRITVRATDAQGNNSYKSVTVTIK